MKLHVTRQMVDAARRAEFDYYQRGGMLGSRFVPTPDRVIREMLEAALATIAPEPEPEADAQPKLVPRIVRAYKPRRR